MNSDENASVVIVAYKPKPGKKEALDKLVASHVSDLAKLGLVTDRKAVICEAADGTVIEVFEWLSADAIKQAHTNPEVHKMWAAFAECCDCVPLNTVPESASMFAGFTPVN
jgi:quinol monooxygenase YgiN